MAGKFVGLVSEYATCTSSKADCWNAVALASSSSRAVRVWVCVCVQVCLFVSSINGRGITLSSLTSKRDWGTMEGEGRDGDEGGVERDEGFRSFALRDTRVCLSWVMSAAIFAISSSYVAWVVYRIRGYTSR